MPPINHILFILDLIDNIFANKNFCIRFEYNQTSICIQLSLQEIPSFKGKTKKYFKQQYKVNIIEKA